MIELSYDRGTLLLSVDGELPNALQGLGLRFDDRVQRWRTQGRHYRNTLRALQDAELEHEDQVPQIENPKLASTLDRKPFPYQSEAVAAWTEAGENGVVVLPTGSGKTFVAQLILEQVQETALIVTPTIDLMQQWYGVLASAFDCEVGLIGGGYHEIHPLTVTTYDSAYIHMEKLGARFGLLVFDECHHLPGPSYQLAAESSTATKRLGLTATPEREDGREDLLDKLIGPIVYRKDIKELAGDYLSDYETTRVRVRLSEEEETEYHENREIYLAFLRANRISMRYRDGWSRFLMLSSQSTEGREAFMAYRRQRAISQGSEAKIRWLGKVLGAHRSDRVLVFTNDNETVYNISRRFLIPAITHQTKVKERHEILTKFNAGDYPFLVTSKVLNEGVDVPAANVAVILSGSGTVREHVQRLGRILRRSEGKHATLYEVVAENTAEEYTSDRRRQHNAYR